jgi:acetyl-CoA carboxylase carboxyl transferase subunit alpha
MARLKTPIIATVIGEGGSGGALAIGMGDHVAMLQYSVYSVISPEGCASILWNDSAYAEQAADSMGMTASKLLELGLIDKIIPEPVGGAHRDHQETSARLKANILEALALADSKSLEQLVDDRHDRFMAMGAFEE